MEVGVWAWMMREGVSRGLGGGAITWFSKGAWAAYTFLRAVARVKGGFRVPMVVLLATICIVNWKGCCRLSGKSLASYCMQVNLRYYYVHK